MTEMWKVEHKPCNGKSSYYLAECKRTFSDEMNVIPNPLLLEMEHQINSFVSSYTELQDNEF